jgi:hypothetical protein
MEIITLSLITIVSRIVPHLPNVTPVGAVALFSSAKFGTRKSMIILFMSMLMSDMVLGFHSVMWATYGSFMITIIIGRWVQKKYSLPRFLAATLVSSVVFFLITNFAVWLIPHGMYAKNLAGVIHCYGMALPFFRNSLMGDILYGFIFYFGYELIYFWNHRFLLKVHQI